MITRLRIRKFRCFDDFKLEPRQGLNILVGDNESGKSTILQALTLALTGRWNGEWASDELTPDWFHRPTVLSFFEDRSSGETPPLPEIEIEVYLDDPDDVLQRHRGVHNSLAEDIVGLRLTISPSEEYTEEIARYLESPDCPQASTRARSAHSGASTTTRGRCFTTSSNLPNVLPYPLRTGRLATRSRPVTWSQRTNASLTKRIW